MYPDLSWPDFLLIHVLNSNILFAIVSCCSHDVGVLVPPVLVLEVDLLSRSRLMTVFTNALSMADMILLLHARYNSEICGSQGTVPHNSEWVRG
jgi:hypothetical protein